MSELDETLSELNERVKTSKLKGKKEIASIKFKLSNGLDSLSIVKKKSKLRVSVFSACDGTRNGDSSR